MGAFRKSAPLGMSWRQILFWSLLGLLLLIAVALGHGRWVFDTLQSLRSTSSYEQPIEYRHIMSAPAPAACVEATQPRAPVTRPAPPAATPRKAALANSNELEARAALERLLGTPFPKIRPPWLVNPRTKRRLECDCYSEVHKACIEVSGRQHFFWPNSFHATREQFEQQLYRDDLKKKLLYEHGDILIVVPWTVKRKDIESFLRHELLSRGFKLAKPQTKVS